MAIAYTYEERLEAAIAYLITGSTEEAGKMCGVTGRTIRDWQKTDWWEQILESARSVKQKELDAVWTALIHAGTNELKKRIDEGDVVLTRTGQKINVPVKARDLALVLSICTDKRALARGQVTSRSEKVSVEDRLERTRKHLDSMESELGEVAPEVQEIKH